MSVSVLIPVYNGEKYIEEAVQSALIQPQVTEIVIVDDGSTDNTLSICQALASQHDLIRVVQHPGGANKGEPAARNLLIKEATGEYVAFLDADDYMLPGRFDKALEILEANPDIDSVFSAYENFYDDDAQQQAYLERTTPEERVTKHTETTPEDLLRVIALWDDGPDTLWQFVTRRRAYDILPPFTTRAKISADVLAIIQMATSLRVAPGTMEKPVIMRRIHETNLYQRRVRDDKHTVRIAEDRRKVSQAMWEWMQSADLTDEQRGYLKAAICFQSTRMYPLQAMKKWRPYRFFTPIRRRLSILILLWNYPSLINSRFYHEAFRTVMLGGRLVYKTDEAPVTMSTSKA